MRIATKTTTISHEDHEGHEDDERESFVFFVSFMADPSCSSWPYFEYSSTMSCSCTGRLICSRVGTELIFAATSPASSWSHSGTPRPLTSSIAWTIEAFFRLDCRTPTRSPGLT